MTLRQVYTHASGLYGNSPFYPWLVLANGDALFLVEDPVFATHAKPPSTIEVLFVDAPSGDWPYHPTRGYYYAHTYPCVARADVRAYIEAAGGIVGLVDAARNEAAIRADVAAHFPLPLE